MIKLMHGDCLLRMKTLESMSIDLIVTDCPYKLVAGGRTSDKSPQGGIFSENDSGFKTGAVFAENDIKFSEWLPDFFRVLKNGKHCYIMINGRNIKELQQCAENVGFKYQNLLVWNKSNKTPNRYYMQQLEFVLLLAKSPALSINNMGDSNLFNINNMVGKKIHPTEKPIELMEIFVKNSSNVGEIVTDPFMGSGTTGIACLNTNRSFIGIEKDKDYFKIAKERISKRYNEIKQK